MDAVNFIYDYFSPIYYSSLSQEELNRQLREAAEEGNLFKVTTLIQNKAEIESKDRNGRTPLMWACLNGHTTTVKFLLQKSANIYATDKSGLNALMFACLNGQTDTAAFLLEKGANIDSIDNRGKNALMWACQKGHTATAAFLLQNGADIHATNDDAENALMFAYKYYMNHTNLVYGHLRYDREHGFCCYDIHTADLLLSYLTSEERDAFSTQSARHFSLVNDFKASLKSNALVVYNKIRHEQWNIEPTSIFNLLPPELRNYIRAFEAQLDFKEKFKDSWYRFRAFTDMNLTAQCCHYVDKPIFPVLFLSNTTKAPSAPVNHPHKKNCPIEEEMEIEENSNKTGYCSIQ